MPELIGPLDPSDKSRGVATALAAALGPFGAHRFYVGKTGIGALMAATLGGLGVWWLYDLIVVVGGAFRDAQRPPRQPLGSRESRRRPQPPRRWPTRWTRSAQEVAELAERLDFAERLLAAAARPRALRPVPPLLNETRRTCRRSAPAPAGGPACHAPARGAGGRHPGRA